MEAFAVCWYCCGKLVVVVWLVASGRFSAGHSFFEHGRIDVGGGTTDHTIPLFMSDIGILFLSSAALMHNAEVFFVVIFP